MGPLQSSTSRAVNRGPARVVFVGLMTALLVLALGPACGGLSSDCSTFCEAWKECVDSSISVDNCETACHDWADGNDERATKVDKCRECVDQNDACSDTNRRCAADCLGIPLRK